MSAKRKPSTNTLSEVVIDGERFESIDAALEKYKDRLQRFSKVEQSFTFENRQKYREILHQGMQSIKSILTAQEANRILGKIRFPKRESG